MENEIIIYHLFVNFVLVQRYMMKTYKDIKIMILPIYIYIFFLLTCGSLSHLDCS